MKTTLYLRIFIVTVMMIMIACDPEITPVGPNKGGQQIPANEYFTSVTTWTPAGNRTFTGLVSTVLPQINLSTAGVFVVVKGQRISMNGQSKASNLPDMIDGYMSASVQNNVLLLNFVGKTDESKPPFPLEVILVY